MLLDAISQYWFIIQLLLVVAAVLILLSSLDDLFIDAYFWVRAAYRALVIRRRYPPLPVSKLMEGPQQPIAILVPAWREAGVIADMLKHCCTTFRYDNYHIFVGTYPNDPDTQRDVDRVAEKYSQIYKVINPAPGPTSKADCLNAVIDGVLRFEQQSGIEFAAFVLHDAEDVNHPLELRLFNYLIPRKDLIQLPVFPLEREWYEFTAGHYLDEFAEHHSKDLVVRESLVGSVPSAGVGTAFSRRAIELLHEAGKGHVFALNSLTEDYDVSFRLKHLAEDVDEIFVRFPVEVPYSRVNVFGKRIYGTRKEFIAVREHFPDSFMASVKQKSRWILGIAYQGWANLGWRGGLGMKYMLLRDRKMILTSQLTILAYFLTLNISLMFLYSWIASNPYRFPILIEKFSWQWWVIVFCAIFLISRLFHRALFATLLYGWWQGFLSIPRQIWENIIQFFAANRAFGKFFSHLVRGTPLHWEKTQHAFPTDRELRVLRRRLGELLLGLGAIDHKTLNRALAEQKQSGVPLGQVLLSQGAIKEYELEHALKLQADLQH